MIRLLGVGALGLAIIGVLSWALSGGLLAVLVDEPVLWLLVLGLPGATAAALLIPDRPRTVRVPVLIDDPEREQQLQVHVHHHHHVDVTHRHLYDARVQHDVTVRAVEPPRRALGSPVVDGQVVGRITARAIEEGR